MRATGQMKGIKQESKAREGFTTGTATTADMFQLCFKAVNKDKLQDSNKQRQPKIPKAQMVRQANLSSSIHPVSSFFYFFFQGGSSSLSLSTFLSFLM